MGESFFYFVYNIAEDNYVFVGLAEITITEQQLTETLTTAIMDRDPSFKVDASLAVYSAADYQKYFEVAADFRASEVHDIQLRATSLVQRKSF